LARFSKLLSMLQAMAGAAALLVLCCPTALAGPRLELTPERLNFGRMNRGERVTRMLRLTNRGDAALVLRGIRPSCAECVVGDLGGRRLEAGESLQLPVTFVATDVPGRHTAHLTLHTNDEKTALHRVYLDIEIAAVASPRLVVLPGGLDLAVVRAGQPVERSLLLHNVGEAPLRIRDFTASPGVSIEGELPAELASDEQHVLKLRLDAPEPGVVNSHVALVTNQPGRRVTTVPIGGYAALPEQVERFVDGMIVRLGRQGGSVQVLNRAAHVAWLRAGQTETPISPGATVEVPGQEVSRGGRIRLIIELPLPQDQTEEKQP
jgi:hypothetical protein